jgi:hypothetical protein
MAATEDARRSAAVRVARVNILLYEGTRDFSKKPRYASTSFIVSLVRSAFSKPFGNRSQKNEKNIAHDVADKHPDRPGKVGISHHGVGWVK